MADKFKDQKEKADIINYQPPRQDLTDRQILAEYGSMEAYDRQMVRYCCTFYNRPNEFYDIFYQQIPSVQSTLKKRPYSPVLQILERTTDTTTESSLTSTTRSCLRQPAEKKSQPRLSQDRRYTRLLSS